MVLLREGYVNLALFADVLANQLLLKCINKGMGANGQWVISCLAAVKCLAVNKSLEVDDCLVAVSNRSVLNGQKSCVLLLNLLELCFHILRLNSCIHLLYLDALVLAQGHFRPYGYGCSIDERLVLANLLYGNFRSGNDLQSAFIHCLHAGCVDGFISGILIENAFAIHLFNHGARCFALTEAWNIKLVLALIEGFFHSILKLLCA